MKRVAILGAGGAGKTRLARELGERLNIAPVHLDALYYDAQWRPTPAEQWAEAQRQLITPERWIIDGNYQSTAEIRLAAADTIVFLDTPTIHRLARIITRRVKRSGPARPDRIGAEQLNWRFIRYVATYNHTRRERVLNAIRAHAPHATIHILRTDAQIHALLATASNQPELGNPHDRI